MRISPFFEDFSNDVSNNQDTRPNNFDFQKSSFKISIIYHDEEWGQYEHVESRWLHTTLRFNLWGKKCLDRTPDNLLEIKSLVKSSKI